MNRKSEWGKLILRVAFGGFMLTHGLPKLVKLFSGNIQFADPIGLGPEISLALTVFSEFVCALLIVIGYKTRWATIPLIITMLVAAFIVHGNDPFGDKEHALLFAAGYLAILLLGPGFYSLDREKV